MLSAFLIGKQEVVPLPRTAKKGNGKFDFDGESFLGMIKDIGELPDSDVRVGRLYEECNGLVVHCGFRTGICGIDYSLKLDSEEFKLDLYKKDSVFNSDVSMQIFFREREIEKRMQIYMGNFFGKFSPIQLNIFDRDERSISEYHYV